MKTNIVFLGQARAQPLRRSPTMPNWNLLPAELIDIIAGYLDVMELKRFRSIKNAELSARHLFADVSATLQKTRFKRVLISLTYIPFITHISQNIGHTRSWRYAGY
jgi:hypothetical protein